MGESTQVRPSPERRGAIQLSDGRALSWCEWGAPDAAPVLFFEGAGTSASLGFGEDLLRPMGLRLIALDRPGLGESNHDPARTFGTWRGDVAAFLQARRIDRARLVAFSQGAPFALACAELDAIERVALVSGTDELAGPAALGSLPSPLRELVQRVEEDPEDAETYFAQMTPAMLIEMVMTMSGERDRAFYTDPGFAGAFRAAVEGGFAHGAAGYARDTRLSMSRWPFELGAIQVPVDLWYGGEDASPVHSPDFGISLARRIPSAALLFHPDAGGALLWTHAAAILSRLVGASKPELRVRTFRESDAPLLEALQYDAIHRVGIQRYSAEQVHAWAPPDRDSSTWVARITRLEPFVAELDGEVVGFMTLESDGHIDLAYTHANHQRRGIAGALYAHLEREARERKIRRLYVEASHLARPFFEQRGFEVLRKNDNVRGDQILVNWTMEKRLT